MNNLTDLYQDLILDHNRHPRHFYSMAHATHVGHGNNTLCGDQLTIYLDIKDNVISEISFSGQGCAISIASASLLTERIQHLTVADAKDCFTAVYTMLVESSDTPPASLGKLHVLAGVQAYPSRVKCATLAWHTLLAALERNIQTVQTES